MMQADRNAIREKAWHTVRVMNEEVMARKYEKVYYALAFPKDLVSVIIPTCKRDTIGKVLDGYARQTYSPIEIIVVDDSGYSQDVESDSITMRAVESWKRQNQTSP